MIEDLFDGINVFQCFTIHSLPAKKEQVDALLSISQLLKNEPEHAIQLLLTTHDDPRTLNLAWQGEGYKMILSYPMEDFGWLNPLLLCGEELTLEDVQEIIRGICLDGRSTDSFPVITNHFRDVTNVAFSASTSNVSSDEESKAFIVILNRLLQSYIESPASETYDQILCHIFDGIANDNKLPVLIDSAADVHDKMPLFIRYEDGSESLALITDAEQIPVTGVKIRTLIQKCEQNENCRGLVFNYGMDNGFYIPLALLQAAIRAGYQTAISEIEEEAEGLHAERE